VLETVGLHLIQAYSIAISDLKSTLCTLTSPCTTKNVVLKGICDLFVVYLLILWYSYSIIEVTSLIFLMASFNHN